MSTIDHLLAFDTEAAALAALPAPFVQNGAFNLSCVFPGLALVTQAAEWDAEGNIITPQTLIDARFWLLISTETVTPHPDLEPLAVASCQRGVGTIVPEGVVRIDGLPAGSSYPFGVAQIIP